MRVFTILILSLLLQLMVSHADEFCAHSGPGCESLSESSLLKLLDKFISALKTGKSSKVVDLYRKKNPLLLATLDNSPITNTSGLTTYFDKFLLNSPVATIIQTFAFLDGNILAGLYNFEVNVLSEKCAPKKCGPTTSIQCSHDCRTIVRARFTFFYECNKNIWKIAHHHSSKLPFQTNETSNNVHHAWK
eukprot:CAMPEP_0170075968 /NCGR_PEP_ID=MMETSP0019_2-20121128/13020_1 /TAXON_ID=98059 /ORGANISM="Dinobryon sp., Strain UTEXLB2267" /LENGTH=189 /DNA_ID=CAMNT_0010287297 /DNA_START=44 /DNA_END=613 /DNA_ORIENTATION=-